MPKNREKVSICPRRTEQVIIHANYLPFDFPDIEEWFPESIEEQQKRLNELARILPDSFIQSSSTTQMALTSKEPFHVILEAVPESFTARVEMEPLQWIYDVIRAVVTARKALLRIVEWNEESGNSRLVKLKKEDIRYFGVEIRNGVISFAAEFPFDDLINENVDTRRIKYCSNCKNFFWAKRLNKEIENEVCEKCSNEMRQKRFVEKNKEAIKQSRRKNYYYKNDIPYCEKCVRPNTKCSCYVKERSKK